MSSTHFLTGALGCIGAWVVRRLIDRGDRPLVFDLGGEPARLKDLLDPEEFDQVLFLQGDVTDTEAVHRALAESGAEHVIHLAGLQVPFCKADPPKGAAVNVLGTLNVFEAAKRCGLKRVAYASSAAVYGKDDLGAGGAAPDEDVACHPGNHYGVFKAANEGNARIYFQDDGISSTGLRPLTVYGVGRDQGMTSDPTRAAKAAVLGRPFTLRFSGSTDFLYAKDCADAFIAAAERGPKGAQVYNLHGETHSVASVVDRLRELCPQAGELVIDGPELPIPPQMDGSRIERELGPLPRTSLEDGLGETVNRFRELHAQGRLRTHDLED